jgi:hypothetical protein
VKSNFSPIYKVGFANEHSSLSDVIPSSETQVGMVFDLSTPLPLPDLSSGFSETPSSSTRFHGDQRRFPGFESGHHDGTPIEAVLVHDQDVTINSVLPLFTDFGQYIDHSSISTSGCLPPIPVACMVERTGHDTVKTTGAPEERVTESSPTPFKFLHKNSLGSQRRKRDQEQEDSGSSKKPRAYLCGDLAPPKFACPFYKMDPRSYGPWENIKYRPCVGPGTPEFRRLK